MRRLFARSFLEEETPGWKTSWSEGGGEDAPGLLVRLAGGWGVTYWRIDSECFWLMLLLECVSLNVLAPFLVMCQQSLPNSPQHQIVSVCPKVVIV
jgi:hypothetical protein